MVPFNYSSHKFLFLFLDFSTGITRLYTIPLEMSTQKLGGHLLKIWRGHLSKFGGQLPQKWEDFC